MNECLVIYRAKQTWIHVMCRPLSKLYAWVCSKLEFQWNRRFHASDSLRNGETRTTIQWRKKCDKLQTNKYLASFRLHICCQQTIGKMFFFVSFIILGFTKFNLVKPFIINLVRPDLVSREECFSWRNNAWNVSSWYYQQCMHK